MTCNGSWLRTYTRVCILTVLCAVAAQGFAGGEFGFAGYMSITLRRGMNTIPTQGFDTVDGREYTIALNQYKEAFCPTDNLSVVINGKHFAFLEFDGEHWRDYHHRDEIKDEFCIPMRDDATVLLERHIDKRTQFFLTLLQLDGEPVANKQKEYSPEETPLW